MSAAETEPVHFGPDGLAPVVVQDAVSGDVLMLAYMNEAALRLTRETGRAHYWSRGRDKLWRKGETSGNEQIVQNIRVNCERNSILLTVLQSGAVCHDGYPTCFYRRVEDDGKLTVVRAREFDPVDVYGGARSVQPLAQDLDPLAEATRKQFAAYAYLRDHDLTALSGTSRLLHDSDADIPSRIADELRELAGVLSGDHRHADETSDFILEASQVIYWVILLVLRSQATWTSLRPDRALSTGDDGVPVFTIASLLRSDAGLWKSDATESLGVAARAHATLALVGQACRTFGTPPLDVINHDLAELRSRPYLVPVFAATRA